MTWQILSTIYVPTERIILLKYTEIASCNNYLMDNFLPGTKTFHSITYFLPCKLYFNK